MHISFPGQWFELSPEHPEAGPRLVSETPGPAPTGTRLWLTVKPGPLSDRLDILSNGTDLSTRIESFAAPGTPLPRAAWDELEKWPNLRELTILSDVSNLKLGTRPLSKLSFLMLEAPSVSPEGWEWIAQNGCLETVLLRSMPVDAVWIEKVAGRCPLVRHLEISYSTVDSKLFSAIQLMRALRLLCFIDVRGLETAIGSFEPAELAELAICDSEGLQREAVKEWARRHPAVQVLIESDRAAFL